MSILDVLCDQFAVVEREDLRVVLVLLSPLDLEELVKFGGFELYPQWEARPEWFGTLVGTLWGAYVVSCPRIFSGTVEAIPEAGGVSRVLKSLRVKKKDPPTKSLITPTYGQSLPSAYKQKVKNFFESLLGKTSRQN
jgi:hypothetical protein